MHLEGQGVRSIHICTNVGSYQEVTAILCGFIGSRVGSSQFSEPMVSVGEVDWSEFFTARGYCPVQPASSSPSAKNSLSRVSGVPDNCSLKILNGKFQK